MKKLLLPLFAATLMFAGPAFADEPTSTLPAPGSEIIPLGPEHERLCNEAKGQQESRIRDLRAAIEFDKDTERKLLDGARVRDADAAIKDGHAKQWREHAAKASDAQKRNAFTSFAVWLETEARTDRKFATERREAAAIVNRGRTEAASAIGGHERFLNDLKTHC